MHQFRSNNPIIWIRISAISFFLWHASALALVGLSSYALWHASHKMMLMVLCGIGVFILTWLLHVMASSFCKCPLCRSAPMSSKRCVRHRNARRFLGSYRMRVALAVLFTNQFRCPYCGEPTRCKVKNRNQE
jgi:hypothetical protein